MNPWMTLGYFTSEVSWSSCTTSEAHPKNNSRHILYYYSKNYNTVVSCHGSQATTPTQPTSMKLSFTP
ncbi:gata-binding factor 6-b [Moniliophthora roreri]|nr:gata-binding factor 6-b [Moniliophthora roreri]